MPVPFVPDFEVRATTPAREHQNFFRQRNSASAQEWETGTRLTSCYEKVEVLSGSSSMTSTGTSRRSFSSTAACRLFAARTA
ncbi:MAG TPA: hypothetical protein VGK67_40930 [Myxococcales bacterium]|jgi:hypothetical protein